MKPITLTPAQLDAALGFEADDPAMPPPDVLEALAKDCRDGCGVECGDRPCPGCMAGGVCDAFPCHCHDDDPEERDWDPDEDRTP